MEKFDPATHRFGMAYTEAKNPTPCWPSEKTIGNDDKSVFYEIIGGKKKKSFFGSYPEYRCKELNRAPEHDLIPKQYADDLAEALGDVPDPAFYRPEELMVVLTKWFEGQRRKALSNYRTRGV